jgi:hypothetical protein
VIENINSFIEGDMDLLDGYEDLPEDVQAKVKRALDQGHVDDEDWKGVSLFHISLLNRIAPPRALHNSVSSSFIYLVPSLY